MVNGKGAFEYNRSSSSEFESILLAIEILDEFYIISEIVAYFVIILDIFIFIKYNINLTFTLQLSFHLSVVQTKK